MTSNLSIEVAEGWLLDPLKKWAVHFEKSNIRPSNKEANINLDLWGLIPESQSSKFKSRTKITTKESIKKWNLLCSKGWKQINGKSINLS